MHKRTGTSNTSPSPGCHQRRAVLRRRVSFNDHISGLVVPSLEQMSVEERQSVWYLPQDKAQLQHDLKNEAKHMRRCLSRSVSPESDQTTARGIEFLASNAVHRNIENAKTAVIHSVLLEQHQQRSVYGATVDPIRLAVASSELSLDARKRAILQAATDQEYALFHQKEAQQQQQQQRKRGISAAAATYMST